MYHNFNEERQRRCSDKVNFSIFNSKVQRVIAYVFQSGGARNNTKRKFLG